MARAYITTPIYYVNDRPHIGHCFTTTIADALARFQRLFGRNVFLLTGTDEHADKVVSTAREHGMTALQWADRNAAAFQEAFAALNISNDDFIRTSQSRHKEKVVEYIRRLQSHGDVYKGDYTGWWDASQEEYLTETVAKEAGYVSPVSGKPLVKRTEQNYFFRLSAYQQRLLKHIDQNPDFILPESRRNEVLGRLREDLQDVPVSRAVGASDGEPWGILMPDDPGHRIYVWIDALFNYLSVVDTEKRRNYWPPAVHLLAKDILWFHAVIWPCMLMALGEPLPRTVYAHAYFVRDGRKMSKSLGNFVDLDVIRAYNARYGRDALRWFLCTCGPMGSADADFAHGKFVEVYNAELANGIGNAASRVGNMIEKYFGGTAPDPKGQVALHAMPEFGWPEVTATAVRNAISRADQWDLAGALREGVELVRRVDAYINATEPFKLAKKIPPGQPPQSDGPFNNDDPRDRLAAILYHCAEALRIASLILSPAVPDTMGRLWKAWNCDPAASVDAVNGQTLAHMSQWGGHHSIKPGQKIAKGEPLFMRADPAEPPPA
ncbi:MAG: methionine--tRNA ligase [Phycisphaeraceae bacterium]|nr:methionine--tRNA ligase [Phycisphaeraceae bacterium]